MASASIESDTDQPLELGRHDALARARRAATRPQSSFEVGVLKRVVFLLLGLLPQFAAADARSDLEAAKERWRTASITGYTFEFRDQGDLLIAPACSVDAVRTLVKGGKPILTVVTSGRRSCPTGTVLPASERHRFPRTIEAAFDLVEAFLKQGPGIVRLDARYDGTYGFPVFVRADKPGMSDSDEGFEIVHFSAAH